MKICNSCKKEKELECFRLKKDKNGKYYNYYICKECEAKYNKIRNKKYKEEHKEEIKMLQHKWYEKNRERILQDRKIYEEKNKDKIKERTLKYRQQNNGYRCHFLRKMLKTGNG